MTNNDAAFIIEMMRGFYEDNLELFEGSSSPADDLASDTADAHDLAYPDGSLPNWLVEAAERIVYSKEA